MNVQLSDLPTTISDDESDAPRMHRNRPPPPLGIYLRQAPQGFIHLSMWPIPGMLPPPPPDTPITNDWNVQGKGRTRRWQPAVKFTYRLSTLRYQRYLSYPLQQHGHLRLIPGASRAVVYSVYPHAARSIAPAVFSMASYVSPDIGSQLSSIEGHPEVHRAHIVRRLMAALRNEETVDDPANSLPLWPRARKQLRAKAVAAVYVPKLLEEQLKRGLSAIAFDEAVGRLVISTKVDGQLHVLDFAYQGDEGEYPCSSFDIVDRDADLLGCYRSYRSLLLIPGRKTSRYRTSG